jgi:hypothetical protein
MRKKTSNLKRSHIMTTRTIHGQAFSWERRAQSMFSYTVRGEEGLLNVKVNKDGAGSGGGVSKKRMNKAINGAISNLIKSDLPKAIKDIMEPLLAKTTVVEDKTAKVETPPPVIPGVSPEVSAQLHQLTQANKVLMEQLRGITEENKSEKARAEKAEREGAIEATLNDYTFTSAGARDAARKLISLEVKRTDDGKLIAGENLPLADFVKEALTQKHDYFLAPAEVGGAGAKRGVTRNSSGVGIETIKPNMTDEERLAVAQEIGRAVQAANIQL